jgi:aryl-alcohol dehydrogenase-like predicted oxidoreductase
MQYRTLGRTGLRVSEVGFGAWAIGGPAKLGDVEIGWGEVDDAVSLRAIDAGVTFFDTADAYGAGRSEILIGKALGSKRGQVVIATKVGNRTSADGKWLKDFLRGVPRVKRNCAASAKDASKLQRNGVDVPATSERNLDETLDSATFVHPHRGQRLDPGLV